ncbi:flippase [Sporolactobacillus sp. THM7-4]|nr:flippase [Sporolactobacillus sp. THM7-4]
MSIAKNYIYNVIYQVIILIIPLITVPYISRVLGSNGIGINAYTNSIIQYFLLFGTIGISLYGNRAIAYVRDDKKKLSSTFWGIFILKLLTTSTAYIVFLIFLAVVGRYHNIFLIQSVYIIAAAADISWLYMGLEDFKKTVVRNLIVKIIGVTCIFIFVKDINDLWKYVLVLSLAELFGQMTMWAYLPRTVNWIRIKWVDIKKHFLPSISLFVPQIAIQIYVILNKTMLGFLSNPDEVGYFDNSDKIVKMVLAVATAMGVVMLPRVANTFARGDIEKVKGYLYHSFDFASYLSIPMAFGLAGIAEVFTPWFFGPGFEKTGILIGVISPIIVFIAWSNAIGQQYLMPTGQVRAYTVSVCFGAIINFILNLLLIRHYQSIGTAVATLVAEFAVTAVQIWSVSDKIKIRNLFQSNWKYIVSGLIMFIVIKFVGTVPLSGILTTFLQIIIGVITYFVPLFILKSEMNAKIFGIAWRLVRRQR